MARKKLPPEVILFSSGGSLIFVFFDTDDYTCFLASMRFTTWP